MQQEDKKANNLDNIFVQSAFKRGMRQMCKELVRSGDETDLGSLQNAVEHHRAGSALMQQSSADASSAQQDIVQIGRSIGTAYRKEILKNIGEIEDDEDFEGIASGQSSKQLILGSESEMPFFGKHLDDSELIMLANGIMQEEQSPNNGRHDLMNSQELL